MNKQEENLDWATPDRLRYELENHEYYVRYCSWKADYPNVLDKFEEMAMLLVNKGRKFGMWLIANKIRWDYAFEYDTEFKINDHYTALITRELMLKTPRLKHFCRIKRLTFADGFDQAKEDLFNGQN